MQVIPVSLVFIYLLLVAYIDQVLPEKIYYKLP